MRAIPDTGAHGHDLIMGDAEAFVTPLARIRHESLRDLPDGEGRIPGPAAGYRAEIPPSTGMTAPLT